MDIKDCFKGLDFTAANITYVKDINDINDTANINDVKDINDTTKPKQRKQTVKVVKAVQTIQPIQPIEVVQTVQSMQPTPTIEDLLKHLPANMTPITLNNEIVYSDTFVALRCQFRHPHKYYLADINDVKCKTCSVRKIPFHVAREVLEEIFKAPFIVDETCEELTLINPKKPVIVKIGKTFDVYTKDGKLYITVGVSKTVIRKFIKATIEAYKEVVNF